MQAEKALRKKAAKAAENPVAESAATAVETAATAVDSIPTAVEKATTAVDSTPTAVEGSATPGGEEDQLSREALGAESPAESLGEEKGVEETPGSGELAVSEGKAVGASADEGSDAAVSDQGYVVVGAEV